MGLFQKKHSIEDLNNITQKVLASNSYDAFSAARENISPKFEKLKFHAPNKRITKSSIQNLIYDLDRQKQDDLEKKKKEQEKQEQICTKKAEAGQLKNETQGYKLNFINEKKQLSNELLEMRKNRDILAKEKIPNLENKYKKLVDGHKSILNIGNMFGDSSKISKSAISEQKREIDEQQNKNYSNNDGKYYEDQFKLLGNVKSLYDSIQQNKYLKQLQEMGEVPCAKIHERRQALKAENRQLDEKLKEHYWFSSNKKKDQKQREKNDKILKIYDAMNNDKRDGGSLIWQNFEDNQTLYISNKRQNKSFVSKALSGETISLCSKETLEKEEGDLLNSTYFKDKAYNEERKRIIEEFENDFKSLDEQDKKIGEKEKEIEEKNKKIKECDGIIKQLDEIINYTPSMAVNVASALIDGTKGFMDFIYKKISQNPIILIKKIKSQNESIYKELSRPTVNIYKYLEKLKEGNEKRSSKQGGFYDFTQIAQYKVFYDNCLKWHSSDCIQYYEYLYGVMNVDNQWDKYIDAYYNETDDKSKVLDLKNDMLMSAHIARTTVSYTEKCMDMGERLCQKMLAQRDADLARAYKEISKSINSIYIYIGGNSSKEISRNDKDYNNIDKFKKLKISKKEKTLKIYDENLGLISNFKRLSTSLNVDLYNINTASLDNSKNACKALIDNIGVKQKQAQEFDEKLSERKTKIEKGANGIGNFAGNQANQSGAMKAFELPQLPKSNLTKDSKETDYLLYCCTYFKRIMEIDEAIRKNFSNNKKLFKKNPYITKMWVESMRKQVNHLKESAELKHSKFKNFGKTQLYENTEKLYLQSTRKLKKYNDYFNDIESGKSIYRDIDISIFFSEAFWTDLRDALNETTNLLQELGFEGRYKEIFRDISFAKVLKYSGTFIRFYKYWIDNISPRFLDFKSLLQDAVYKGIDAFNDARSNQENLTKSLGQGREELAKGIDLILFPGFFDNTKSLASFELIVGALKSREKVAKIKDCFSRIDKAFNAAQYETKRKYEKQKEDNLKMDKIYKQKSELIKQLNEQIAKNK